MINLCNTNKYSLDPDGSIPSKRVPRPIEDIEIIGIIKNDEIINMVSAGSCGLSGVGSITTTFDRQNRNLTIQGSSQGVFTDPGDDNPRHPTGEALSGIMANNPLRAEHGWYTIDPTYSIGYLSSNSQIIIDNIGLNNKELNAYNTQIKNATYANGILSTNNLEITNSYFYNTDITCSGINIENNTKIDSVSANGTSIKLSNSSVADCNIQTIFLSGDKTPLIDSTIFCSSGTLTDCDIQSEISQQSSNTGSLYVSNCRCSQKSRILADSVVLLEGAIISGNIVTNGLISSSVANTIASSGGTIETNFFHGSILNSGIFSFSSRSPLPQDRPEIINYGRLMISATGDISLLNYGICMVDSIPITGSGSPPIMLGGRLPSPDPRTVGAPGTIFVHTTNDSSGIIEGELSFDKCINSGYMRGSNTRFYNDSSNFGLGEQIYFIRSSNHGIVKNGYYSSGSTNYGSGEVAEFYHDSKNIGPVKFCKFFDNAKNLFSISNAIFKNSGENSQVAGTGHLFYDTSINRGPLTKASFYNNSTSFNAILIDTNFYDNSNINGATLPSGFINCYDNVSGLSPIIVGSSGTINLYDTSHIREINTSISGSCLLYDTSRVDRLTGSGIISLYDRSIVENTSASMTLYDSSKCSTSSSLLILRDQSAAVSGAHTIIDAYDNSTISGNLITKMRLNDNSRLLSSMFIDGLIIGDAKLANTVNATTALFTNGASTPSGASNITNVMLSGNSTCDVRTSLSSDRVLLYNSINLGRINATNTAYCVNSNNRGTGIGISEFGSGSVNYGVISGEARFYIGSSNLGIVSKGYYHPSVTQTGISVQPGELDPGLEQLDCSPIPFSFDSP